MRSRTDAERQQHSTGEDLTDDEQVARNPELAALQRIGCEINSTLDPGPTLNLIVQEAVHLTAATCGSVFLGGQQGKPRERARYRQDTAEDKGPRDNGKQDESVQLRGQVIDRVFATEQAISIDDIEADLASGPVESSFRSLLAVPIRYGPETIGVLELEWSEVRGSDCDSQLLATVMAELAATAIGNAQRYAEQVEREQITRQRNAQLRDLIAISRVLHTGHELTDVLDQIVQAIPATGGFNVVLLGLVEGDPPTLRRVAAAGIPLSRFEALKRVRLPLSAFDHVLQARYQISHSYFLPHQERDRWQADADAVAEMDASAVTNHEPAAQGSWHPRDVLLVPLRDSKGQLLGLLSASDPQDHLQPGPESIEILELFANEAASAIENTRLYDELESRVHKRTEELAEALIRQATEADKTRAIVEGISDAVIVFDPDGRIILTNPATARVMGLGAETLLGQCLDDPLENTGREGAEMTAKLFRAVSSARRSLDRGQDLVSTVFHAAERVIHASFSATALQVGEPLTVVAVLRDVTQEAELDRAKSELISTARHELRAPISSILSYVDVLMSGALGQVNDKHQEFLEVIRRNAQRLMKLISDLLDVSRIESGELKLDLRPVSMSDIVADAVRAMGQEIETKEQTLVVDVPPDLPAVMADREWMIQVVTNLLSNACKYSPPGSQVTIRGLPSKGNLRLDIQDSGIGISAQDQRHLFTRFFRADNAIASQEMGTGLGLAICREILVRHGGTVQVDSELGRGSTFSIVLPLATG